jgi:hypothetical protein
VTSWASGRKCEEKSAADSFDCILLKPSQKWISQVQITIFRFLVGGTVTGLTGNFSVHGTSTTERITMQFVTPIPQADCLQGKGAPYPVYPTDVEKK